MDYIDFQLKIGPRVAENQYAVSARSQAVGETSGNFIQPLTDEQLELFVLKVGLARRNVRRIHSPEWRAAQDFGQKLFRSLFTEEIRAAYLTSHNDAVRQSKGLRIKLTLDAPELANYPWEFLFDPSSGQFLSLFEDTPIIRYTELPRPILPLRVTPPLRILAVASSPKDYEPLDLARERRNLSQALDSLLQTGGIELDWLMTASLDGLREQLLKRSYHIFHFIGHGGFDANQEDGILIFENANGYANRVSGERLAVILGNHRTLRLAVLNACEGARTSEQDPFAGTAMTLVRTGNLPAVIAMQFEITDRAAIDFASGFYSAIAACRPVDAAMSQGRQAIFAADNDVEWSTPVLYLRAADGVIFQIDPSAEAAQAKPAAEAQAEQERAAREMAAVAYASKVLAEQERLETERREQERLEQERAAREKSQTELAAALVEKKNLEKPGVEPERAEEEPANIARSTTPSRPESMPEGRELAQPASPEELPLPRREVVDLGMVRTPFLLAEVIWALAMGFFTSARDLTTNVLGGTIIALVLVGVVYWWGRRALAPRANHILLVGLGAGFAVQMLAIFVFVKPLGDAVYESLSPALGNFPGASADFILAALRAGFFAIIGGGTGLAVMAQQIQNTNKAAPAAASPDSRATLETTSTEPEHEGRFEPAGGLSALSQVKLIVLSGISLAAASAMTVGGALAFSFVSEEQPRIQLLAILLASGVLLLGAFGAWVFGAAISRIVRCNRTSRWILVAGAVAAFLIGVVSVVNRWDVIPLFVVLGLLTGGYVALALRVSNHDMPVKPLGIIGAGWLVGFVLQGIATAGIFVPDFLGTVWEPLLPLVEATGDKPMLILQILIVGFFVGSLAPIVGLAATFQRLNALAKKQ